MMVDISSTTDLAEEFQQGMTKTTLSVVLKGEGDGGQL
jgi:hypothetical protein